MFLKFFDDKRKSCIANFKMMMMMMMITGDKIRNSMIIIIKKKCCCFTNWSKDIQRESKYITLGGFMVGVLVVIFSKNIFKECNR